MNMKAILLALLSMAVILHTMTVSGNGTVVFGPEELQGKEQALFADMGDGVLDQHSDLDVFVIASGLISDEAFTTYRDLLQEVRNSVSAALGNLADASDKQRGNRLLYWLHDNLLKTYDAKANSVRDIIDDGRYNCLTASLVYALLAKELGLDVRLYASSGHVFAEVVTAEGPVVVETTVRYGFAPGKKEIARMEDEIHYVVVPKKHYEKRRASTIVELAAALYTNRSCHLVSRSPGSEECLVTLPLYKRACALAPDNDIYREYLLACLHNLALAAMDNQDLERADALIAQAGRLDPGNQHLSALRETFYSKLVSRADRQGDYPPAIAYLEREMQHSPDNPVLRESLAYLYMRWGEGYFTSGDYREAAHIFARAWEQVPQAPLVGKNYATALYNLAVRYMDNKAFDKAVTTCKKGADIFPQDKQFDRLLPIIRANHKIALFNRAVDHYNAANFRKALALCRKARAMPGGKDELNTRLETLQRLCEQELE